MNTSTLVQSFAIPTNRATKKLRFKKNGDAGRKIVVSSNWLPLFDFNAGEPVVEESLGVGKGIVIKRVYDLFDAPLKSKKVYYRNYKSRKNNPLETLLEVASKKLINLSFPKNCKQVHVTFQKGCVTIVPVMTNLDKALENATPESRYEVFAACTSGVDLCSMENNGFSISSVIEHRPCEARDGKRDHSETGALSVLRNIKKRIKNLFNEDITHIDLDQIREAVSQSPVTTFMASPQCDDFSTVKSKSAKQASLENLSTTEDMMLDMLRVIEAVNPPVVCFEQVGGWYTSAAYRLLSIRLKRWGYTENLIVADARDHGGLTSRKRGYAVFTCLDADFSFEAPVARRETPIWELIEPYLSECRDVTHSKSIQDGAKCGRLRTITKDSKHSPTFLKSQPRMAKDSVVISHEGRYLWPSEELQKMLMGIDPEYKTDAVSKDIGSEIIGQSIDGALHDMVIRCVKNHIDNYFNSLEHPHAIAA